MSEEDILRASWFNAGIEMGRKEREKEILEIIDKELKLEKTMTNDKTKDWINTTLERIKQKIKENTK